MNLSSLLAQLKRIPEVIERAETRLDDLLAATRGLRDIATQFNCPPLPDLTFVYLLPPDGPMLAQSARVPRGRRHEIAFEPYRPLEAGTWVVAVGPAQVSAVIVGVTFQSSSSNYQGQVCKTSDTCEIGARLRVELESLDREQMRSKVQGSGFKPGSGALFSEPEP